MRVITCCVMFGMTLAGASISHAGSWPGWRGQLAQGRTDQTSLPTKWSVGEGIVWKASIPGVGHASPIVWDNRVFVTTAASADAKTETFKPGLYFGGNQDKPDAAKYTYLLMCLDADSGKILWSKPAVRKNPSIRRHIKNSYASETPVTDGQSVFASFGAEGLYCFDFDGNLKWKRSLGTFKMSNGWGTASSPVLFENLVIQMCDRENGSAVVAFDKKTGNEVWRTPRDEKSSWATPYLFKTGDRTELITNASKRMRGYDPATGKLRWECEGASSIVSPTPVSTNGLVIVSSGYVLDSKRPIYAFRPGVTGDISLAKGQNRSDAVAWHRRVGGPYIPSPVILGKHLSVLLDRGFLTCYEAETGKPVYGKQRLGRNEQFTASPIAGDGKVYCLSEDGTCYVIKAGPTFEILAVNKLDEVCMASPAVTNGRLFIRARKHLYCIGP